MRKAAFVAVIATAEFALAGSLLTASAGTAVRPHAHEDLVAPGQTRTFVSRPSGCHSDYACGVRTTISVDRARLASRRALRRAGLLGIAARRRVYQRKAHMKMCQSTSCGAWYEEFSELFFFDGGKAWHDRYGYNHSYVKCDKNGATFGSVDVKFCGWRGPNPAYYGHGNHMSAQVSFKVSITVGPVHKEKTYSMSMHNYGDGYVGRHNNDSD